MVRGPRSGDGARWPVHCPDAAWAVPSRSRALGDEMNPLAAGVLPGGILAADSSLGWSEAGQLMDRGVRVAATGQHHGMVVSGDPASLPAPPQITPSGGADDTDRAAQSLLMNEASAFSQASARADRTALNRPIVRGAAVSGLGGEATFDSISALHGPTGGTGRQITVSVICQRSDQPGSAAGNLGMTQKPGVTYGMSVVDLHSSKWYLNRDWSVGHDGGSPMTRRGPAGFVMSARRRPVPHRSILARPRSAAWPRSAALICGRPTPARPAVVRAALPGRPSSDLPSTGILRPARLRGHCDHSTPRRDARRAGGCPRILSTRTCLSGLPHNPDVHFIP